MACYLCWGALCLLGLGLLQTNAFEVEIKDDNMTCIYASINVNFTISYENSNGSDSNVTFAAPDTVTTIGSNCQLLNVSFGNDCSWSLNFTKNDTFYSGDVLIFTYNTNNTKLFPDAKRQGLLTSVSRTGFFSPVSMNASYKCFHEDVVTTERVAQVYWNVTLQAYVQNSTLGKEVHCSADISTTAVPTTPNVTMPSTTATPPKPTPKPDDKPSVGNYFVLNGTETCLLASMGVQLNASVPVQGKNVWTLININPNTTVSSGSCGNESALLRLTDSNTTVVEFNFFQKNKKFHLQEVNVILANGTFQREKGNLTLWEASLGNSYLCHKEQLITVFDDLLMNTLDVRVQPFGVQNATYATASQCHLDDDSILIPIIVGAALSGLIVIIVIAYLVGRRKTYAGYQTL